MATPRRLNLKAEIIHRPKVGALVKPIVRVWVDSGVFHLDSAFDYVVPEEFSDLVAVGVRVQVPFNGREVEAIVLERIDETKVTGTIKTITKILSPQPVASTSSLQLIALAAAHWGAHPFDILRSAIPPRVAAVDKTFINVPQERIKSLKSNGNYAFIAFEPFENPAEQVVVHIQKALAHGSVLLIAPDGGDIDVIVNSAARVGISYLRLDSSLPRAVRYENYLKAMQAQKTLVIGARGAVFTPIRDLETIIVYKESSHDHYEIRTPAWNVKDVVNLRKSLGDLDIFFMGYTPSLDLSLQIESKQLAYIAQSHRISVKAFSSEDGTLLPGTIFTPIRKALTRGPVLFLVPRKGYGNALLCAHCKNLAMCTCGSRLVVTSKGAAPSCTTCLATYPGWKCSWCQRDKQYVAARGIERASEEIARAFTGLPIILSFGDVIKATVESKPSIVLSTPGAVPRVNGGYGAIVILEGLKFFAHPDLRAQERARELFFETAAMINTKGEVLLSIDESHPIVASLIRWSPGAMIRRELAERAEIPLPPYVRSTVITSASLEATTLFSGLEKAIESQRLPSTVRVFGPHDAGKGLSKIVLYSQEIDSQALVDFLHELQRRRSIAKKELLSIRVDPYSL